MGISVSESQAVKRLERIHQSKLCKTQPDQIFRSLPINIKKQAIKQNVPEYQSKSNRLKTIDLNISRVEDINQQNLFQDQQPHTHERQTKSRISHNVIKNDFLDDNLVIKPSSQQNGSNLKQSTLRGKKVPISRKK